MKTDIRFVAVLVKVPRELLAKLDAYAEQNCGGNRSFAIRRAVEQLISGGHAYQNTSSEPRRAKR